MDAPLEDRASVRVMRRRLAILAALLGLGLAVYGLMIVKMHAARAPSEATFAVPEHSVPQRLQINIEALSVEAVRQAANLRLEFLPAPELRGKRINAPDRELTILLDDRSSTHDLLFSADLPMDPATVSVDLYDGDIMGYPFDRYTASLRITSFEGRGVQHTDAVPVPAGIYFWGGIPGWFIFTTQDEASQGGDVTLRFTLVRSAAIRWFALAMYGAMVLITSASLTVASMVFLGRRRLDFAMLNWLAAIMFTLPAVRYALPGAPPLGIEADLLIFLWAILVEAFSMALVAVTWLSPPGRG
jgi:Domain of unknown function (DUF4436)